MTKKRKTPRLPRLKCPSEKVFKDKRGKRTKKPTAEELRDMEGELNE